MDLLSFRRNYLYGNLRRSDLCSCPIEQFRQWFEQLQNLEVPEWFEVNTMTLATSSLSGEVASRVVLLKSVDNHGFYFFTNYGSTKGKHLEENPHASLTFFWPMLERQVRVEGRVSKASQEMSDHYFHSRPRSSQLGAMVSPQSEVIGDDEPLEAKVSELEQKYRDLPIPRPEFWGGYCLSPTTVEFWQGKPSRLHDRFRYSKNHEGWIIQRLAP